MFSNAAGIPSVAVHHLAKPALVMKPALVALELRTEDSDVLPSPDGAEEVPLQQMDLATARNRQFRDRKEGSNAHSRLGAVLSGRVVVLKRAVSY